MPNDAENLLKLVELLREAVRNDSALREKYHVENKFRFIRDRLATILSELEQKRPAISASSAANELTLQEDEVAVHVYLYNAQGLTFKSWLGFLNPKLFYEYSINRPIYAEQAHILSMLRSKTNKAQHGYVTVIVPKDKVISLDLKDAVGNPVIKVREGALKFDKMVSFTHNDQVYCFDKNGELVKKN